MISIKNLNLTLGNNLIFKDASLNIPKGKVTVITGANGAGKTTLFRLITGNIKTDCKIENDFKKLFYLPQKMHYPKGINTFDYVSSVYYKNSWKWFLNKEEKFNVIKVLGLVELLNRKDTKIEDLSAGELQKANIALGLLSDADVFLLDEPTSNMDLVNQIKILDMLKNLTKSGITSVIIMHDLNLAASYGEHFAGIKKDKVIFQAGKNDFFTPENLKDIYNIDFNVIEDEKKLFIQISD